MTPEPPQDNGSNGRKYRSKKQRPCDLCRSRKIQCKLQGNEAACELCKRLDRRCTFVLGPLRRKCRARVEVHGGGGLETNQIMSDEQHDDQAMVEMAAAANGSHMGGMDATHFWMSMNGSEQAFSPRTASNLLAMNWATMEFPMGVMPDEANHMHHRAQADHDGVFMRQSISPRERVLPNTSQGSRHVELSSESPSSGAEADGHANGHLGDSAMDLGIDGPRRSMSHASDWPEEFSLDSQKGYSNLLVGLSSEFDPYFLRHYLYNVYDTYRMFRLHIRKVVDDAQMPQQDYNAFIGQPQPPAGNMPVQFVTVDEEILKDDIKFAEGLYSGSSTEKSDLELLNKLVPADFGARLVKLYTQFVHPRYPVLSLADLARMPEEHENSLAIPIGLRSAVYALAAPFTFLDDELSVSKGYLQVPTDDLWAIAHRSFQRASRLAHLSLLQLCLLLHQMPPPNFVVAEPPGFWALSCSALAIAESLGLNLDPSDWRLPKREIKLRRRLWWLTYSAHTWQALVCSRPSHIHDSNWDVSKLSVDDFEADEHEDPAVRESLQQQIPICLAQSELSVILADVLKEFYTLKANRDSTVLSALLTRAQPLRTRIECWRQTLPFLSKPASELTEDEFESGAALRLSHLTVEILIFRALLRPLLAHNAPAPESSREPISAILENCYTCAKVATEIVSSLRAKHFASFWPPYMRYQLCYISTFILLNLAQSPTKEVAVRYRSLLSKWRDTLRIQARAWPLARLATMRLDAIFWKGLSSVVHGAGPESPAVLLFKEQGSKVSAEG